MDNGKTTCLGWAAISPTPEPQCGRPEQQLQNAEALVLRASWGTTGAVAAESGAEGAKVRGSPTFLPPALLCRQCHSSHISCAAQGATRPGRRCLMQALALLPLGEARLLRDSVGLKRSPSCSQNSIQHLTDTGNPLTFLSPRLASEVLPPPPGGPLLSCRNPLLHTRFL